MKIDNLKELQKLIQLCRKTGVEAIEIDNIKMNLGPTPVIITNKRQGNKKVIDTPAYAPGGITEEVSIPTDGLTEEQLLFYSAQGHTEQQ